MGNKLWISTDRDRSLKNGIYNIWMGNFCNNCIDYAERVFGRKKKEKGIYPLA